MFKFNKNDELLATVEKQKDQIDRYEGRLRDIVHAYKSLQNEKEALEKSMKALTLTAPVGSSPYIKKRSIAEGSKRTALVSSDAEAYVDETESEHSQEIDREKDETEDENEVADNESLSSGEEKDSSIQHLKSQIYTLTQSLSTVSDEKSKIVATYQAEKKKLKKEQEIQIKQLHEESEVNFKKASMLQEELTEFKERVRLQQIDREQEQATHSIMLREIQKMLNDERTKNNILETSVKELRNAAQNAEIEAQQSEDYKQRVRQLEEELNQVRKRLHSAELEASTPSPLLLQLQEEMEHMKREHKAQLEKEHARVTEVEKREREVAHAEEERVADLENRLVQISNKLGTYDGRRQKDQISIQHLKDRISQLDIENALLTKQLEAAKSQKENMLSPSKIDDDLDIDGLKERIMHFQELLKTAISKSNEPVDLTDIARSLQSASEDYQKLYLESQQELLHLKEEFERYKTRAQNVLKNMKSGVNSSTSGNRETEEAKRQLQEARERHFLIHARCEDLEAKCVQLEVDCKKDLKKQAHIYQTQIEELKESHSRLISEKERETRTQRERTIAMLADKDKEIKQLKAYSSAYHSESCTLGTSYGKLPTRRHLSTTEDIQDPMEESLTEIMSKSSTNDSKIIHYAEQLARRDVTINSIRRYKKQLELQIRQLQDASITKDEKNAQEVAELKEKISECERSKLRENANMEYLKNVFYRYITTADYTAKQRMLVALVTILQFSPEEARKSGVKK
ncbi:unnamed protein product [Clavelina lepadiformis]|uniref:GRIP domain-containing protein n=1 Tax=Clavelina lepadiformis TaxID=159417 RepID=A0ABP0H4Q3_CLALP